MIQRLMDYRNRLQAAGRLIEARAVDRCIAIAREHAKAMS